MKLTSQFLGWCCATGGWLTAAEYTSGGFQVYCAVIAGAALYFAVADGWEAYNDGSAPF